MRIDESAQQQQFNSIGAQIDDENNRKQYFGYKIYTKWTVNNAKQLSVQQIVAFYSGVSTTSRWQCGFQPQLERLQDWIWKSHWRILAWLGEPFGIYLCFRA